MKETTPNLVLGPDGRPARDFYGAPEQNGLPSRRVNWLGPRFEPMNISATATLQDIQVAIRQAENGETTSLFRFFRDALLGDDHIQGEILKRKLAVIGQPTAILPVDKSSEDDMAAAAACLRAVSDCANWNTGLGEMLNSFQWPVTVTENIYRAADPEPVRFKLKGPDGQQVARELRLQYTLKRLASVNPMLFCFRHAYLVGGVGMGTASPVQQAQLGDLKDSGFAINLEDWEPFLRLWPIDDQGRIIYDASRASKLDPNRHIVHRGHMLTDQKDNWGGPMRTLLFLWLFRRLGWDWWARFMERYGMPFPVGKTNVQDRESVALLESAFQMAVKIGGLIIGQEDDVDFKESQVQGGAEGHATWHRTCNDAISRHITGYGSSDKPAGMNAGEDNMVSAVRQDIRIFDQRLLAETLEKQLLANFLRFNGLRGRVRAAWGGLSPADAKTFAELLKTTKEAGWEPTDGAIPVVEEKLGIEVQRVQTPAPLPGAPGDEDLRSPTEAGANDQDKKGLEGLAARRRGSRGGVALLSATQASAADALGVPPGWLNPLREFLVELERKAADQSLSDQDLLDFLEKAQARVPELFKHMDVDELAHCIEAGMGKAVMDGIRQRLRQKPELAEGAKA